MSCTLKKIVIVGGGTAGWLTAGVIAAEYLTNAENGVDITLIESPDVAPLGVGEGTWPSMRTTLKKIGISEVEFLLECDASYKQGSKFCNWVTGQNEFYLHPFALPVGFQHLDLAPYWRAYEDKYSYADMVCVQGELGKHALAPKQLATEEYAFIANYGYHLDATRFARLLKKHCVEKLGVKHVVDHVTGVRSADDGDIASVSTKENRDIVGDLFIDCSGARSLLLGEHYNIPFANKKSVLFNDTALAVQVPYEDPQAPIQSFTISTAQSAGWIWDIGLPSRRGVGYTFSSQYSSDEEAEKVLRAYISPEAKKIEALPDVRKISFNPGYREKFWHRNCVAIGVSAGFIEPLEASALALIEVSAKMVSEQLPLTRKGMDIVAKRFNEKFTLRWQQIVEFLKLHYVLSKRTDSEYWNNIRRAESIPDELQALLEFWKHHAPSRYDSVQTEELFPTSSYQYILYGMGFRVEGNQRAKRMGQRAQADKYFNDNRNMAKQLVSMMPTNRALIRELHKFHRID